MSANPEEDWHERLGLCSAGKIVVFAMHTELAVLGQTSPFLLLIEDGSIAL